jgi:hypothetical protein
MTAPAHTALSVQQFLATKNMAVVPHTRYSPNLAPCDFFLFQRMKSKLKWRHFQDVTEIQEQSLTVLHVIPKSQFQRFFQQWQKRWKGNTLKGIAMSNTKVKRIFRYQLSPGTFGYTLVGRVGLSLRLQ